MKNICLLILLFSSLAFAEGSEELKNSFVQLASKIDSEIEKLPVQNNGRIKPFDSFARETNLFITGKRSLFGLTPAQFYLGLMISESTPTLEVIEIRDTQLRTTLGFTVNRKYFSLSEIEATPLQSLATPLMEKEQRNSRLLSASEKSTLEVFHQVWTLRSIVSGEHLFRALEYSSAHAMGGLDFSSTLDTAKKYLSSISNGKNGKSEAVELVAWAHNQSVPDLFKHYLGKVELEIFYNKSKLFFITATLYLILGLLLLLSFTRKYLVGWKLHLFFVIPLLLHSFGFGIRVYITGFAPVTNMYGTMLWVSFGVALFSWILFALYKNYLQVGFLLLGASLTLLITENIPLVLSPDMDPIVAVLRSNLWLTIHVLTITLSYAAFTICMLIGNYVLVKNLFFPLGKDLLKPYVHSVYRMMQLGVMLLTAGIILGGVWADYSWGRFWGWDPKETWSLIANVGYLAILHARYVGWVGDFAILALSPLAYLLVIMAWYGVNFILAAGLHSYGFSSGGAAAVGIFVLLQTILLIVSYAVYISRKNKIAQA